MPPQTPNSMLKDEIAHADADESFLLLSPAPPMPMALSVSRQVPIPAPVSAVDNRNAKALSLILEQPEQPVELPVVAKLTSTTNNNNNTKQVSSPLLASGMTSTDNNATATIANTITNANTPFTSRGNGVCMDLSDIFYDAASTARKTRPVVPLQSSMPRLSSSRKTVQKKKAPITSMPTTRKGAMVPQATAGVANQAVAQEEEDWAEKQCETFSNWLNYTFQPSEERDHQVTLENGRTQDRVGLRTLVLHQRMAQARTKALEIFHSQEMTKVQKVVLSEIYRGRLSIRKDRDMYADLTLRNEITSLLLSYTTPWLRLGLETLFGESILPLVPHQFSPNKVSNGGAVPAARPRKSERVSQKCSISFICQSSPLGLCHIYFHS
jgi:hypothetical protein